MKLFTITTGAVIASTLAGSFRSQPNTIDLVSNYEYCSARMTDVRRIEKRSYFIMNRSDDTYDSVLDYRDTLNKSREIIRKVRRYQQACDTSFNKQDAKLMYNKIVDEDKRITTF